LTPLYLLFPPVRAKAFLSSSETELIADLACSRRYPVKQIYPQIWDKQFYFQNSISNSLHFKLNNCVHFWTAYLDLPWLQCMRHHDVKICLNYNFLRCDLLKSTALLHNILIFFISTWRILSNFAPGRSTSGCCPWSWSWGKLVRRHPWSRSSTWTRRCFRATAWCRCRRVVVRSCQWPEIKKRGDLHICKNDVFAQLIFIGLNSCFYFFLHWLGWNDKI